MRKKPRYVRPNKAGRTLTQREIEVLWLLAEGHSNKIIADNLGISEHTAKFHVDNAINKMGATTRTKAAVDFVMYQGLAQGRIALKRIAPASPLTDYAKYRDEMLEMFAQQDRESRSADRLERLAAVA